MMANYNQLYFMTLSQDQYLDYIGSISRLLSLQNLERQGENQYHMIILESLNNILIKKVNTKSKFVAKINAHLFNVKTNLTYPKTAQSFHELEERANFLDYKEGICFYFYSSHPDDLILRLDISVIELIYHQNEIDKAFLNEEQIGLMEIHLAKDKKSKQKRKILRYGESVIYSQGKVNENPKLYQLVTGDMYGVFSVQKSDNYKPLQKIIPSNFICNCSDKISGIVGSSLPKNQYSLTDFSLIEDSKGLTIKIPSLTISSQLVKQSQQKAQFIVRSRFSQSKINCTLKQVIVKAIFHNGWRVVSTDQLSIEEKMQIQLKNNAVSKLLDDEKVQFNKGKGNEVMVKYKTYSTDKFLELGLIFPKQEECVMILQVQARYNVGIQIIKKNSTTQTINEVIDIPLCFSVVDNKQIMNLQTTKKRLFQGSILSSPSHLLQFLKLENVKAQEINSKKHHFTAQMDNVSIGKTVKSYDNKTNITRKVTTTHFYGVIQFQTEFKQKDDKFNFIQYNQSIKENVSIANISKIDGKDKISMEKQRMVKQSKKAFALQTKKVKIQLNKRITQEQKAREVNQKDTKKVKLFKQIKLKEQLLLMFVKKTNLQQYILPPVQIRKTMKNLKNVNQTSSFIEIQIRKSQNSNQNCEYIRLPIIFHQFLSNDNLLSKRYFGKLYPSFENLTDEIIRTELTQLKYVNCFFFNFLQISTDSIIGNRCSYPRLFFFRFDFWIHKEIVSQLMQINQNTGEIELHDSQQQENIKKIIHVQVSPQQDVSNYDLLFVQFLRYIYNGILQVEIIDASTQLLFGHFYFPLRDLLRKKRNQVNVSYEDYIYGRNEIKGKLKMEIKTLRKEYKIITNNFNASQINSQISQVSKGNQPMTEIKKSLANQISSLTETDTRMERIQKYKTSKLENPNDESDSTKIAKVINKKYFVSQQTVKAFRMKKMFFDLTVQNKNEYATSYKILVSDDHFIFLKKKSIKNQLCPVRDIQQLQEEDKRSLKLKNQTKNFKSQYKTLDSELTLHLNPGQRCKILLCYLSSRKYRYWDEEEQNNELLETFNRERIIVCSFSNANTGIVELFYNVRLIPLPDCQNISFQFYRPIKQKNRFTIPFVNTQFLTEKVDFILCDQPYSILSENNNFMNEKSHEQEPIKHLHQNYNNGLIIENYCNKNQRQQINICIVNNNKRKRQILKSQLKQQKIKNMLDCYISCPTYINVTYKVLPAINFMLKGQLWHSKQATLKLDNSIFKDKDGNQLSSFYIMCENQRNFIFGRNKSENDIYLLNAVNHKQNVTNVRVVFNGSSIGTAFYHANLVSANRNGKIGENYNEDLIIGRILFKVEIAMPNFKQILKINLLSDLSMKILEQDFTYRNNFTKKMQFRIMTTDPTFLWVQESDERLVLASKEEKKLKIYFNLEKLMFNNKVLGRQNQIIVLGVKFEKGMEYFGFRFNIN